MQRCLTNDTIDYWQLLPTTYLTSWPRSTQTTTPHSALCWLWHRLWVTPHIMLTVGNFYPTPLDRVNKSTSNNIRLTYNCHTFLETQWHTWPTHLTSYWVNIRGLYNSTCIDWVNKSISNDIRLTYKCHTLLKASGQGLPIYQHIGLTFNPKHIDRVNKHIIFP